MKFPVFPAMFSVSKPKKLTEVELEQQINQEYQLQTQDVAKLVEYPVQPPDYLGGWVDDLL